MWCWGISSEYGPALASNASVPVEVGGGHTFVSLSLGDGFNCGLDASGDVWCLGKPPSCNNTCGPYMRAYCPGIITRVSESLLLLACR